MRYLNFERLSEIDVGAFRGTDPYPWVNPEGVLTDEGFARLVETLPDPALFKREFGIKRSHGQASHDRLSLEYRHDLDIGIRYHEDQEDRFQEEDIYQMLGGQMELNGLR